MTFKYIKKAAFKRKNIIILVAIIIVSIVTQFLPFIFVGLAGYIYFVLQTLKSQAFQNEISLEETREYFQEINARCSQVYNNIFDQVGNNEKELLNRMITERNEFEKYLNTKYIKKELLDELNRSVLEQAFQLINTYMKLIYDSYNLLSNIESLNSDAIQKRINRNSQQLKTLEDVSDIVKFTQAIEMDQQLLKDIKEHKHEIELIRVKLDNIENMVATFKNHITSSEMTNTSSSEMDNILNEASALDNALKKKTI